MKTRLQYIVNADDFGLNRSVTEAIVKSFRRGLITDTTIMATGEDFEEAVSRGNKEFPDRIGIHFNLTEGTPLTEGIKLMPLFCSDGTFHGKINRLKPLNKAERKALYDELSAQCRKVREAGVVISHADSHHHIHTGVFIAPIVFRVCKENGIKAIRIHRNVGPISTPKRFIKKLYNMVAHGRFKTTDFMGGAKDIELNHELSGSMEIMVHPILDSNGNIVDKRADSQPLLESIEYWKDAEKICYNQL